MPIIRGLWQNWLVCVECKARLIYIVTLSPKRHSFLFRCHLGVSIFMSETILLHSPGFHLLAMALCHNSMIIFIQLDGFSFL